jgi:hypothetical protein
VEERHALVADRRSVVLQAQHLQAVDLRVSLVVDTCDVTTGKVLAVTASWTAEVHPFDPALARKKLTKYLGGRVPMGPPGHRGVLRSDEPARRLTA